MFDIAPSEFLLVAIVALVVIGPKDLPKAMRIAGHWVGRARGVARQFRTGFDAMVREAELAELEKQWKAENERIMREHPVAALPSAEAAADVVEHTVEHVAPAEAEAEDATPVMVERPVVKPAEDGPHSAPDKAAS